MNNISILDKDECCGCTACYSACPTKAISMQPDNEGFLYPSIDFGKCINCGKCLRVCKDVKLYETRQKIFCIKGTDEIRKLSSSGGVFSMLSNIVFDKGGYVCAVGYSDSFDECLHKIISTPEQLDDLRRAKFVQSKKYDIYNNIKSILNSGKFLLFCGTPCEVGGLRQFLGADYENLITIDLICGCVSSPAVYKKYIEHVKNKYKSGIVGVNFKDKRMGWRGKGIAIKFDNGEEYYNSILDDNYCVSFHSRYNIRPSCFNCKYRNLRRTSDITLGDFWAIEKYDPSYDDNKGTSFVLVNSPKGEKILSELQDVDIHEMNINLEEYCTKFNWCMHRNPYKMNEQDRETFYKDVFSMDFDDMAEKDLEQIKQERKSRKLNQK